MFSCADLFMPKNSELQPFCSSFIALPYILQHFPMADEPSYTIDGEPCDKDLICGTCDRVMLNDSHKRCPWRFCRVPLCSYQCYWLHIRREHDSIVPSGAGQGRND